MTRARANCSQVTVVTIMRTLQLFHDTCYRRAAPTLFATYSCSVLIFLVKQVTIGSLVWTPFPHEVYQRTWVARALASGKLAVHRVHKCSSFGLWL